MILSGKFQLHAFNIFQRLFQFQYNDDKDGKARWKIVEADIKNSYEKQSDNKIPI
jgi:hypothetical protein